MKKPRAGIAKRPRDLEKFLSELVDEVNAIKAEQAPMIEFLNKVLAKSKAKAKAKAEAGTEKKGESQ